MANLDLTKLETEIQNPQTLGIDTLSSVEIVKLINQEDQKVAVAVSKALPQIAELVDVIVERLKKQGRLIYIGAGSSGRIGFADAAECPPTYGLSYETVQALIAGGFPALYKSQENAEDDEAQAIADVQAIGLNENDVLVGIAASGRTPYVIAAMRYANEIGCYTGSLACVSNSEIGKIAKTAIETVTGEEVITGSTRMKAGTATKMVLNMISTAVMVRLGKVYNNLMVDVKPTNQKLIKRSWGIITKVTGCDEETAKTYYEKADRNVKLAIFMFLSGLDKTDSERIIAENDGHLKNALKTVGK